MLVVTQQTLDDFAGAHHQVFWERISNIFKTKTGELLSFYAVQRVLGFHAMTAKGLQEIEVDQIIGSVGRHREFTRSFLPKDKRVASRWRQVDELFYEKGFDPIKVYKVGQVYFVMDGNHRVSVSRAHNLKTIEAYVIEFTSPVPVYPDDDLESIGQRYERFESERKKDINITKIGT
ncbi:MAG: hypothetical protein H6633_23475 [Anaerolineales bacterium]|nr:hypothetical protein [Anaerolineales bacterium]